MRNDIVHPGAGELTYEIRNIVNVAEKLQKHGVRINWENIGDPIVKGEVIPAWMKEIVAREVMDNDTWGYCHTRGVLETREFICDMTNKRSGAQITPEDIIFFNGLGDAIAKVYGCLRAETRVLMPSPTYTTHSIGEAGHAHAAPVCYRLKPEDNWYPDLDDLRNHVKYNPAISAIMIINPDNPTGMVYPVETLQGDRRHRPGVRPVHHRRRGLQQHRLQRRVDRPDLRRDRRRAGHRHEGDLQGIPLARLPLRLDRGLQLRPGRALRQVRQLHPEREDERGLLHHPAAEVDPGHHDPPGIPGLPGGADRPLRKDEQHHLQLPEGGAGADGQPDQRRLLHGGRLRGGAFDLHARASRSPIPR